jgi:hypothetical protein
MLRLTCQNFDAVQQADRLVGLSQGCYRELPNLLQDFALRFIKGGIKSGVMVIFNLMGLCIFYILN